MNNGERIQTSQYGLWFRDKALGPVNALLTDPGELKHMTPDDGVVHVTLPRRVDLVWTAGDSVVVGEMKRPDDLVSSIFGARQEKHHRRGRLARQLRACLDLGDVAALVLRGLPPLDDDDLWMELIRIQACGIFILPVPEDEAGVVTRLAEYRPFLEGGGRAALAALAGSDQRRSIKGTLLKSIKGMGLGSKRLDHALRTWGTAREVFKRTPEELQAGGLPKAVVAAIQEGLDAGLDNTKS